MSMTSKTQVYTNEERDDINAMVKAHMNADKKLYVNWNDFERAVDEIAGVIGTRVNLIGCYRGGLPLAVNLAHKLNSPLSIVKFQSYGEGIVSNKVEWLHDAIDPNLPSVFIDDIYDTGKTWEKCSDYLNDHIGIHDLTAFVLFKYNNGESATDAKVRSVHKIDREDCDWVVFPWET